MCFFKREPEKPNYWKIVTITLSIIAGIAALGYGAYVLYEKYLKDKKCFWWKNCDNCDLDDLFEEFEDDDVDIEVEAEEEPAEEAAPADAE